MNNSLLQLVKAQLKAFFREPGILFWAFGFPVLMALMLGMAFTKKAVVIRNIGVIGSENSKEVLELVTQKTEKFKGSVRFHVTSYSQEEATLNLKRGKINLYISKGKDNQLQYYFDKNNSESYLTYLILEKQKAEDDNISELTAKGERYIDFFIPGLISMGIMNSCLWGMGWTLIEYRLKKLMRRIVSTPLPKYIFLLSFFISRLFITAVETTFLLTFSYFFFSVEIQGNIFNLALMFAVGIFSFGGVGVLVSSKTSSTQIANGLINAVGFPMTILSGIFFSYHSFPEWFIPIIQYLPLTLLTDSIRGIIIEGTGFQQLVVPILVLISYGIVTFLAGIKIYKWD